MSDRVSELQAQIKAGQRVWHPAAETKVALVRFQRDVVQPLRTLAKAGAVRIAERNELYRGARFVVRVEVTLAVLKADK